jgi:hypothetical protein
MDLQDQNIIISLSREGLGRGYVIDILAILNKTERTVRFSAEMNLRILKMEGLGLVSRKHEGGVEAQCLVRLTEEGAKLHDKLVEENPTVETVLRVAREAYECLMASSAEAPAVSGG